MNTPTRIGYGTVKTTPEATLADNEPICEHCAETQGVYVIDWDDDPDSAPTCATCGLGLAYFDIGDEA